MERVGDTSSYLDESPLAFIVQSVARVSRIATTDLVRVVSMPGAVMLGLGSILGTGIFVSIGIAAGVAGSAVVPAVALAAVVASFNGLSSAQLAAAHPRSGGTYEYGYRFLNPVLGFTAGWMFLWAKSASAATAALGFAGYLLPSLGGLQSRADVLVAVGLVGALTALAATGMRRSSMVNTVIVSVTLVGLGALVVVGLPGVFERGLGEVAAAGSFTLDRPLLHATALMFVAYTGYGRIATLGEEIRAPRTSIPKAILITLGVSMTLYVLVTLVAISAIGAPALSDATRSGSVPLLAAARALPVPALTPLLRVAAVTAMAGVLLNLVLGLSRVALAMGRRGDLPAVFARVRVDGATPLPAVLLCGGIIAGLTLIGRVEVTWEFSAFTVLVYYSLTNLAALRLSADQRLYPRAVSVAGLVSCLSLAFFVDATVWGAGLGVLAMGLVWHVLAHRLGPR